MFKRFSLILSAAVLAAACTPPADQTAARDTDPQTEAEKFGYAIGVDLGQSLAPVSEQVDVAALKQGLDEALAGREPRMSEQQRDEIKNTVARKMQEQQMEQRLAEARQATARGAEFLAENGKREGVVTTDSGLQYEVVTEGEGASPTAEDKVTVHYRGTLIDGTEFDSSYSRGQPVTFPLANVIAGWTEGLQLMKVGGKSKLFIPPELGYGERGAGNRIGPNETLVFEVELLEIEGQE
jgi:FKBP-type peptidyl-prolyl cis-trans isomerase